MKASATHMLFKSLKVIKHSPRVDTCSTNEANEMLVSKQTLKVLTQKIMLVILPALVILSTALGF